MSNTTATAGRHKISGQPHFAKAIRSQQCTGNHANQLLTRCAVSTVLNIMLAVGCRRKAPENARLHATPPGGAQVLVDRNSVPQKWQMLRFLRKP